MKEIETTKPQAGLWDRLPTEDNERKPKVIFEINIPIDIVFTSEKPIEFPSDMGGVYYIFNVKVGNEDKILMTSAWSLLIPLKTLTPLLGKKVRIVKKILKGKNYFEVEEIKK